MFNFQNINFSAECEPFQPSVQIIFVHICSYLLFVVGVLASILTPPQRPWIIKRQQRPWKMLNHNFISVTFHCMQQFWHDVPKRTQITFNEELWHDMERQIWLLKSILHQVKQLSVCSSFKKQPTNSWPANWCKYLMDLEVESTAC